MRVVIFGGTGMTGQCCVQRALEKGYEVRLFVRDESKIPDDFKDKVEIFNGDVMNYDSVEPAVEGMGAVVIVLGTRNDLKPTQMMSVGTKNIIDAMNKQNVKKFSACMSSFLLMEPDKVPKMFEHLNADHKRMLDIIKASGLEFKAVLPPHIADEPCAPFQTLHDKSPGRTISKYDLGNFFIDCLDMEEHSGKVIGIATIK